ncbi:hypothetical protein MF406_07920 [Georgenia sp. TF02-10]|uniref:hypothetical protein n=1 Tax=Georgenia sp. TF02-10 TaxID=2917725 RepID=UPI001FA6FB79|nr:hypothetical protein [Georgenia sp. TF02-10]UNX56123.1 hypothetical protein MF406_07920 [Georgenia sp. TF02-10]
MTVRDEAHQLLDEVPEERLADAVDMLHRLSADSAKPQPQRRRFRTTAVFDGEPDLGVRAKEIVREGWDGRHTA